MQQQQQRQQKTASAVRREVRNIVANTAPHNKVQIIKHTPSNNSGGGGGDPTGVDLAAHRAKLNALQQSDAPVTLNTPALHTTLAMVKKLEALHIDRPPLAKCLNELTPRSQSMANVKVRRSLFCQSRVLENTIRFRHSFDDDRNALIGTVPVRLRAFMQCFCSLLFIDQRQTQFPHRSKCVQAIDTDQRQRFRVGGETEESTHPQEVHRRIGTDAERLFAAHRSAGASTAARRRTG